MPALPLVVAGVLAAAAPAWPQSLVRAAEALRPAAPAQPGPPPAVAVAPPEFEVRVPGLELQGLAAPAPPGGGFGVGVPTRGSFQLRSRRTGVGCTLRIVVAPSVDRGIVRGRSAGSADRIVRNDVSPCVE